MASKQIYPLQYFEKKHTNYKTQYQKKKYFFIILIITTLSDNHHFFNFVSTPSCADIKIIYTPKPPYIYQKQ
jgi:hypothetical protein